MASHARPRATTPTSPSPSPSPRQRSSTLPRNDAPHLASPQPAPFLHQHTPAPTHAQSQEERIRAHLEEKVRAVVDHLYQLAVCAADVHQGSEHLVGHKVNETIRALAELDATKVNLKAMIPEEVIEMLDAGRNPDIHTRNFITRLAAENQYSYGQHLAMKEYNAKLTSALDEAFPDLAADPTKE
ncbi:RNA polymerase II mediator complex subunit [Thecaphora frezii]